MKKVLIPILFLCLAGSVLAQPTGSYVTAAKKFFENLQHEKFHDAYVQFDSSVMKVITEKQNEAGWKKIHAKLGALKNITSVRAEEVKPYMAVYVTCLYDSAQLDCKIVLNDKLLVMGYFFVPTTKYALPTYADSNATTERNITVKTGKYELSGILTLPKKGGPFPVVILVHGSGPNDRDETIGLNKPFKDLALGLAAKGIATIRYDKRTYVYGGKSASDPKLVTLKEETVDDAVSALRMAQTMKEIDPKKIYLLGHSLGAFAAPRIAKQTPFIAGVIFMAGQARPSEDVYLDQMTTLLPQQAPKKQADSLLQIATKQVAMIKKNDFNDSTAQLPLGLSGVYWKDMKNYDQVETAKSLSVPMLFLQGENDYQVRMADFNLWKKALSGKKNAQFISYPGFFHLFFPGEGKYTDYQKQGHVSEKVISDISAWIKK
ncbi:MAG: alpha/beta fold hydrolase [Bacteroidota bacterium]|nr:alpha/beta fold hydrolase [Bacteroidota bacterium]